MTGAYSICGASQFMLSLLDADMLKQAYQHVCDWCHNIGCTALTIVMIFLQVADNATHPPEWIQGETSRSECVTHGSAGTGEVGEVRTPSSDT